MGFWVGLGRLWDASGTPLGRLWDASGTPLGRLERDVSGTPLGRLWGASWTCLGRFWDASGTPLKQPFVAGRKGDRLDENRGFRAERKQYGSTSIDSLMLSDLSKT